MDWPGRGERHLVKQEAAVHRHNLDRLNAINDPPPKKKKFHHRMVPGLYSSDAACMTKARVACRGRCSQSLLFSTPGFPGDATGFRVLSSPFPPYSAFALVEPLRRRPPPKSPEPWLGGSLRAGTCRRCLGGSVAASAVYGSCVVWVVTLLTALVGGAPSRTSLLPVGTLNF